MYYDDYEAYTAHVLRDADAVLRNEKPGPGAKYKGPSVVPQRPPNPDLAWAVLNDGVGGTKVFYNTM